MLQPLRVALCLPLGTFTRELKTYQKTRAELKMVTFFREQLGNIYQFFFLMHTLFELLYAKMVQSLLRTCKCTPEYYIEKYLLEHSIKRKNR